MKKRPLRRVVRNRRRHYPNCLLQIVVDLLLIGNVINLGPYLKAPGLLIGGPIIICAIGDTQFVEALGARRPTVFLMFHVVALLSASTCMQTRERKLLHDNMMLETLQSWTL
jgi:hypothetical protein